MKKIWVITLFPEYFTPLVSSGILSRAFGENGPMELNCVSPRDFAKDRYKSVDDYPFGGGPGMVMRADVLLETLKYIISKGCYKDQWPLVIYPDPKGAVWNHKKAKEMALNIDKDLIFVCGRYEGIDQRFIDLYVDETYSLGDFVLTGGEIPVMAIIDSFLRFVPGIVGNEEGPLLESFEDGLLESPQYTRPQLFEGLKVPDILISGNHKKIDQFKRQEQLKTTKLSRPDLYQSFVDKEGSL